MYLPLNIATLFVMMTPISVAVVARIVLKEEMKYYDIISTVSSLVGIIIILDPFKDTEIETQKDRDYFTGTCFGISAVLCIGFISVFMRYMRDGIHYSLSPFWFSCSCTLLSPIVHAITRSNS